MRLHSHIHTALSIHAVSAHAVRTNAHHAACLDIAFARDISRGLSKTLASVADHQHVSASLQRQLMNGPCMCNSRNKQGITR